MRVPATTVTTAGSGSRRNSINTPHAYQSESAMTRPVAEPHISKQTTAAQPTPHQNSLEPPQSQPWVNRNTEP